MSKNEGSLRKISTSRAYEIIYLFLEFFSLFN